MSPSPPAGPPPQRPKGGGGCRSGQQEAPKPKERGKRGKSPLLLWSCSFPGGRAPSPPSAPPRPPGAAAAVGRGRWDTSGISLRCLRRSERGRGSAQGERAEGTAQVPRLFAQVLKRISRGGGGLRGAGALARGGSIPPSRPRGPSQNPQNN